MIAGNLNQQVNSSTMSWGNSNFFWGCLFALPPTDHRSVELKKKNSNPPLGAGTEMVQAWNMIPLFRLSRWMDIRSPSTGTSRSARPVTTRKAHRVYLPHQGGVRPCPALGGRRFFWSEDAWVSSLHFPSDLHTVDLSLLTFDTTPLSAARASLPGCRAWSCPDSVGKPLPEEGLYRQKPPTWLRSWLKRGNDVVSQERGVFPALPRYVSGRYCLIRCGIFEHPDSLY